VSAPGTGGGWRAQALCRRVDPEWFFPPRGGSLREARQVCGRCPVRAECLRYALDYSIRHGLWGGLSERERGPLRRAVATQRRAAA